MRNWLKLDYKILPRWSFQTEKVCLIKTCKNIRIEKIWIHPIVISRTAFNALDVAKKWENWWNEIRLLPPGLKRKSSWSHRHWRYWDAFARSRAWVVESIWYLVGWTNNEKEPRKETQAISKSNGESSVWYSGRSEFESLQGLYVFIRSSINPRCWELTRWLLFG